MEAPLLARDRELGLLRARLGAALAGRGSLALIGGEAGIGKTALAEVLCREATAQGALALIGHCYDADRAPPYGPWIDLFARYRPEAGHPPPPAAFARRGTIGTADGPAVLADQLREFLAGLMAGGMLVLVLEDLHWADAASLDLLRVVAREVDGLPLLALATFRADELTLQHPLYPLLPALEREVDALRL